MANKPINALPALDELQSDDLLAVWDSSLNTAVKMSGTQMVARLTAIADGHGGISSWDYTPPVAPSLQGTLTLTLADESVITVPIMNGAKGDQGNQTYVWIMYSATEPDSDSDMSVIPAPWMGIYVGLESTQGNLHYTDYTWYEIKGEKGDTGEGVTNVTRTDGDGSPGTTDTYTMYAGTEPIGNFVVYNGINGDGAVSSVNNVFPDVYGDVQIYDDDIPICPLEDRSILLIGDSYNYGTGGINGCGWGYYFNQQNGLSATIIHNDGGGFAAVGNQYSQYPDMTHAQIIGEISGDYDLVIAQAGWNDCSTRNSGGAAAIVTGVNAFITAVKSKWAKAEIIILPTMNGTACTSEKRTRLAAMYDTAFDNYVRSSSQSYLWMNGQGYTASDGVHLTDGGYQLLAKFITRFYKGWDGVVDYPNAATGTVTPGSLSLTTTDDNFYLKRIGGVAYFMIRFTVNVSSGESVVCTLPEGFRPPARVVTSAFRVWNRQGLGTYAETVPALISNAGVVTINTSYSGYDSTHTSDFFIQTSFPV